MTAGQDPFADPQNDFVKLKDYEGRLALFSPTETKQVATVHDKGGVPQETVTTDVVILDGEDAPQELRSVLVFNRWIVNALKHNIGGKPVLGVIGVGQAQRGKNAPLILTDADDTQKKLAREYIESQSPFSDPSS
jgi:hypothetical protein